MDSSKLGYRDGNTADNIVKRVTALPPMVLGDDRDNRINGT